MSGQEQKKILVHESSPVFCAKLYVARDYQTENLASNEKMKCIKANSQRNFFSVMNTLHEFISSKVTSIGIVLNVHMLSLSI